MKPPAILVIERDEFTSARVSAALEGAGYEVTLATGALDGLNKIYQTSPAMIIMDSELGLVNGEDAYTCIRQATFLPMIVLGNQEEVVDVLELGADAVMVKPPVLIELVARVRRLLEQNRLLATGEKSPRYTYDDDVAPDSNGHETLDAIEFRLALCLILSKGDIVEYNDLIEEAWGGREVSLVTLDNYIRGLRRKLQAFFRNRISITDFHGIGYRLEENHLQQEY